jgi:uncharacterized membrane protein
LHLLLSMGESELTDSNPAAENIRAIVDLERQTLDNQSWQDRLSERITRFAGSLRFVAAHAIAFLCWASWNALGPTNLRFDPYPFGLLTFLVSMEGVLIATFVLIAQNRMSRQSDHRDHLDLQVDLLAEQEMTLVLRLLHRISDRLGIEPDDGDVQRTQQLTEQTNVYELMQSIKRQLPENESPR